MNHFILTLNFKTAYYLAFKSKLLIYFIWLIVVNYERFKLLLSFSYMKRSIRAGLDGAKIYRYSLPLNFKEFIQYAAGRELQGKYSIVDNEPGLKEFFQKWQTVKDTPGKKEFIERVEAEAIKRRNAILKQNNEKRIKLLNQNEKPKSKNGNKRKKSRRK